MRYQNPQKMMLCDMHKKVATHNPHFQERRKRAIEREWNRLMNTLSKINQTTLRDSIKCLVEALNEITKGDEGKSRRQTEKNRVFFMLRFLFLLLY